MNAKTREITGSLRLPVGRLRDSLSKVFQESNANVKLEPVLVPMISRGIPSNVWPPVSGLHFLDAGGVPRTKVTVHNNQGETCRHRTYRVTDRRIETSKGLENRERFEGLRSTSLNYSILPSRILFSPPGISRSGKRT